MIARDDKSYFKNYIILKKIRRGKEPGPQFKIIIKIQ